jgi:RimJ/RimL family protein N-acetyltransferase
MNVLETERLVLRAPEFSDVRELAVTLNDFDISKNLSSPPYPYTEADAEAYVTRAAQGRADASSFRFAVRRKADSAFIGCCGLHKKEGAYNIGYWVARPFWRQGYASEAARRVIAFAFDDLGVDGLLADWHHDNGISGQILAKLGFKAAGVHKEHSTARGHEVLCNLCQLTREDYRRPAGSSA